MFDKTIPGEWESSVKNLLYVNICLTFKKMYYGKVSVEIQHILLNFYSGNKIETIEERGRSHDVNKSDLEQEAF